MKQAKVLTDKELKKVIDYIDAFDRHAERNRAIVMLTHYLGLRISECGNLLVSDVINDKGEIAIDRLIGRYLQQRPRLAGCF